MPNHRHARAVRVVVSVEPATPTLSGWLQTEAEPPRRFVGWLELASAIHAAAHPPALPGTEPNVESR